MIFDEKKAVRQMAFQKILQIRDNLERTRLRTYKKADINFECTNYTNIIDLNDNNILFEPPYTKSIPYDHLIDYKDSDVILLQMRIPCHIQATERCIKEITRASKHVTEKHKAGFVAMSAESREKMPRFESKQDYK